jgi:hypothetical protein
MRELKTTPKPILQKFIFTLLIGAGCFTSGSAFYLYARDGTAFALSVMVLAASVVRAFGLYRIIVKGSYETVEGTCAAISSAPLRKTRSVKIVDDNGLETTLRLGKDARLQIGSRYRIYFAMRYEAPLLSGLDSAQLLGFEAVSDGNNGKSD